MSTAKRILITPIILLPLFMGIPPALPPDTAGQEKARTAPQMAQPAPKAKEGQDASGRLRVEVPEPAIEPAAPGPAVVAPQKKRDPRDF